MKASVVYYPNQLKKNPKNGKIPIYMRVCYKRNKTESRLNAEISTTELGKWDQVTMRFIERNSPINQIINRLDQKFSEFLILHSTDLNAYTASFIKDYILGNGKAQVITVLNFADTYFENAVALPGRKLLFAMSPWLMQNVH